MKPRTLSRGMNRLRKCVALLVTCSLLLMIFAPASQAYRNPSPADPVSISDDDPWQEIECIDEPDGNNEFIQSTQLKTTTPKMQSGSILTTLVSLTLKTSFSFSILYIIGFENDESNEY